MKFSGPVLGTVIAVALINPSITRAAELIYRTIDPRTKQSIIKPVAATQINHLSASERATLQPNRTYHISWTPNDSQYDLQWNLAAMNMPGAWEADTIEPLYGGDPKVVVAVLDTGVAYENYQSYVLAPDLQNTTIWTNQAEVAGDGIDNDGNGYIDDVKGWDFINSDAHPNDDFGHGTHVTSVIAASTNNSIATAGIAFNVMIMPLKVLDNTGNGNTQTIAQAIGYAVKNGANIINLSLGGTEADPIMEQAVKDALAAEVQIVAAVGNEGAAVVNYPARYVGVMAVGAVQYDNTRTDYSNVGPGIQLMAPGGNVDLDQNGDGQPDGIPGQTCANLSCTEFGTYFYSGTSQAAAHVAGVAALLAACGAPPGQLLGLMTSTATDLGPPGYDEEYGAGLVNAQAALAAAGCQSSAPTGVGVMSAKSTATAKNELVSNRPYPYRQPWFSWTGTTDVVYQLRWGQVGQTPTISQQTATTFQPTVSKTGIYRLEVNVVAADGQTSGVITFIYRYRPPRLLVGLTGATVIFDQNFKEQSVITTSTGSLLSAMGGPLKLNGSDRIIIAPAQVGNWLKIYTSKGTLEKTLYPFGKKYTQGVNATLALSRNQSPLIVATMATGSGELKWLAEDGTLYRRTIVSRSITAGLRVAAADVNGDGEDEAIIAESKGSRIWIYDRRGKRLATAQPLGKSYAGGWSVGQADVTRDGIADAIFLPRTARDQPPVYVWSSSTGKMFSRTLAGSFTTETQISGGDINGDGLDEFVTLETSGVAKLTAWTTRGRLLKQRAIGYDARTRRLGILE